MNPSFPRMNFPTSHAAKSTAAIDQMYKLPPSPPSPLKNLRLRRRALREFERANPHARRVAADEDCVAH